jgi:UPF0271 protein
MLVDLNCDLGESYYDKRIGNDSSIIPLISSCNIACGFHGGDPLTIQNAIDLALKNNVNIGAHPSFPDLENFGRKFMKLSAEELKACLNFQIGALYSMVAVSGSKLKHVKPHGALYNAAANDFELASIIVEVVKKIDKDLILLGMSNSEMKRACEINNLKFVSEVFADRNYTKEGLLVSRALDSAVIHNIDEVKNHALKMVLNEGLVVEDTFVNLKAESICVHGDNREALDMVKKLLEHFEENNIQIASF